ncbi:MAG: hypothetical protein K2K42_00105 [Eubacterium sp.]|nr:hypothetical protein [Eubacterium sp.]
MKKTINLKKCDFSYREFSDQESILHDKWLSKISLNGNILTIEYNDIQTDEDTVGIDLYNQFKDYKRFTVTYDIMDIDYFNWNYVDEQFSFNKRNHYKGKRRKITDALDKLNNEINSGWLCFITNKISWNGIIIVLNKYDIHLQVTEITYNWE